MAVNKRIETLKSTLGRYGLDCFLITDLTNVRYLSGFAGSNAQIILTAGNPSGEPAGESAGEPARRAGRAGRAGRMGQAWFLTDPRYAAEALAEIKGFKIRVYKNISAVEDISRVIKKTAAKRAGFESKAFSCFNYNKLKGLVPRGVSLVGLEDIVEKNRAIKDSKEVAFIKKAIEVAGYGFKAVEKKTLCGRREREVSLEIERVVKKQGAETLSFDVIAASGPRSALPHARPSEKTIKRGEFVIIDMGVTVNGYSSDETRTYVVGRPTKLQKSVYSIVRSAHDRAIDAIRAGVEARRIDTAARQYIERKGYGRFFSHGTGHGVGMSVHEMPGINPKTQDVLEEGMVVAIEPAIYIPGWGGVRIESMALVKKGGCEVLTKGGTSLRVL